MPVRADRYPAHYTCETCGHVTMFSVTVMVKARVMWGVVYIGCGLRGRGLHCNM